MRRKVLFIALAVSILPAITLAYTGYYVLAQGMRIQYGDSVEGEIAEPGDTATWNFDGVKGDTITVQVARTGGNLVPLVTIEDPQGRILVELDWPEDGPPTVLLSASLHHTGTHAITIRGDDNSTGTYNLNLDLEESSDPSGTGGGILSYGDVVTGDITDTMFRQFWTFRGTKDDVIDVSMAATTGDLDAFLSLTSPDGQMLYSTDSGGSGTDATLFASKLPATGLYSLSARRAGANFGERGTTQGTYSLALTLRTPGETAAEIIPAALILGTESRGQLTLDAPSAFYSVVTQRPALTITLDLVDPAQIVAVSMMTPNRALLGAFSGIAPLRSGIVIPGQGGEVWVEVSSPNIREGTLVGFSIQVDQLATAQQTSHALLYDKPRQVSPTSTAEEPDAWHFAGRTGDMVEISVSPYGPVAGDDMFSIYAPDGTLLLQRGVNTGFTQPLALRAEGPYELFLGPETAQTGYAIAVKQVGAAGRSFEQHAGAEVRGLLVPGIDNPISGQLTAGQSDAWNFDVTEPGTWLFSFTQTGSGIPPGLAVEAPDGTWLGVVIANRFPGANNLRVHLPSAGRYHAVIFDPSGQGGSTYTFYGNPISDGSLPLKTVSKGALTAQSPEAFWEIMVPPDSLLSVEIESISGSALPYLHIIAPDGTLAATNAQGEEENSALLPGVPTHAGGVFQVVVSQPAALTVTPYHISADIQTPFQSDAAIALAANTTSSEELSTPEPGGVSRITIAGQITPVIAPDTALLQAAQAAERGVLQRGSVKPGALYEVWAFNAQQGEMLEFSVVAFDETAGSPDVIILDQNGAALAESFQHDSVTNYFMQRFPVGGRYYVAVGLEHSGPYTLWLDELAGIDETVPVVLSGNVIAYGETLAGELVEPGQTSRYIFYGQTGDGIFTQIVTTQDDLRLHLSLLDAEDNVLSEVSYGDTEASAALENVSLPTDGIYQIIVSHAPEAEASTGRFALHLNLEQSGTLRGGGVLDIEQVRSLSRNDSVHRWLFDAHSGEEVTIRLDPVTADLPAPLVLQIADTAGNVFQQREASVGNTDLQFEHVLLPRTGIYQIIVTGGDQQAGIYRISLERDLRHISDNPGAISYGETAGQVLTQENYLDVWSFAGSRGDVVSISTHTVRGDATTLSFQVRTGSGEILATAPSDGEQANASVRGLALPLDGHYSIVIGNVDGAFTGEVVYALTVQLENTPARSMGSVTGYGQMVEGDLYPDDPVDVWLFEGQEGDLIAAQISSDILQPTLSLVSTDWHAASAAGHVEVLASVQVVDDQPAPIQSFVLPTSAAYALVVQNPTAESGHYHLTLEGQSAAAVPASPITPGYAQHAALSSDNLFDAWTFDGSKGALASVTVSPENRSTLAPGVMLIAPDGTLLAQTEARPAQVARIEQYPLTLNGTYTVIVKRALGEQGRTAGGYALDVVLTSPGDYTVLQTEYGRLERHLLNSETVAGRWTFAGRAGDVVRIRADATSGDLDPALVLYSPEGYVIASGDDSEGVNAELIAALTVDGSYEVEVSRYNGVLGTTEGNYSLLVENVYHAEPMTSGPLLVYGDHVTGTIDSQSSNDTWTFSGEKGDVVRVQLQFPVDDAPLSLILRDPSSVQRIDGVRERGGSVIEMFTLPTAGFYVIDVRRPGDARAVFSPYELDIALTGAAETMISQGGNILIGQAVTGGFDEAPAAHNWFFQASGGQTVSILISRLSGAFALQTMLVAPDGEILSLAQPVPGAQNALSTGSIELPLDGLYTLLITGQETALGSKYRLAVQPGMVDDGIENTLRPVQDVFGAISSLHSQEIWDFEAEAGDLVSLRAATIDGDLLPALLVWGPDGRPLIEGITEQTAEGMQATVTLSAPVSGTYRVTVSRERGDGSYRLMLRNRFISSRAAAAVDLAFDQSITSYSRGVAPQLYAFQGLAGDVVGIGLRVEAGMELPELAVEAENGTLLDAVVVTADGEINIPAFVLPLDGRYLVTVNGQETVQYTLTIFRREPDIMADADTRNLGRGRNFREAVGDAGSPTYWIFPGRMGEVIEFTVDTTGSGLRADITLYGPHGYIASATEIPGSPETVLGPVRLPDDGSYTLLVGPWLGVSGGSIGQYTVRADTAPSDVSGSNGGHLAAAGVTVTGGLIPEDARDVWTYNAAAGEVVTIRAEQTGGDGALVLKLMGPDGSLLATGEVSTAYMGAEIPSFVLNAAGVYEIVIEGVLNGESPVEYRLALIQRQSAVLSSMEQANGIRYGESRTAVIPVENIYQAWVFYGQMGERITAMVEAENPALYLVGPGGAILLADAGRLTGATFSGYVLPETGFYGLVVGAAANAEYTVTLEQVSAGAAAMGLLENEGTGQLTIAVPAQEWEVAPLYSGSYSIQVTSLIPHTPLDVFVLSGDNTLLATGVLEEPAVTWVTVRLDAGERVAVIVSGGPAGVQGHYQISLAPLGGGTLEADLAEVGRISTDHFTDAWTVNGQTGQTLTIEINRVQGDFVPLVTVFDNAGLALSDAITADDAGQAIISLELPRDGSYTVLVSRVGGGVGDTWGDYTITARLE